MEKEQEIKEVTQQLIPLLENNNNGSINYQIEKLKQIEDIVSSNVDEGEKEKQINGVATDIFPPRGGLTDYHVWKNDPAERVAINKPIGELNDKLWRLIRK